jgi:DNA replication protein DnaC
MRETATLPLLLKQLRLPSIFTHWEAYAKEAAANHWSYAKYLSALSELEVNERYNNRIQRYARESKLPAGKTLATFNFALTKSINHAQIEALSEDVGWIKQAENIIIFGPSGVGKTHLASAIGYAAIMNGIRVLFMSTTTLVQKLQIARKEYKLSNMLNKLGQYPLLILDDIGYVKKDDAETNVLFELIADRYESASIIITANQPFSEWDTIFPDNMMAVAAIDRLIHHATIINIQEESYRKLDAAKSSKHKI